MLDIEIRHNDRDKSPPVQVVETWSQHQESVNLTQLELKAGESKMIEMDWVALPLERESATIELRGILRYGERENDRQPH